MAQRTGIRAVCCWLVAVSLSIHAIGCSDRDASDDPFDGDRVIAMVNSKAITEREVDAAIRPELEALEQSRYALRLQQLHRMIAARVLGADKVGDDPEQAFREAQTHADIDVRLPTPKGGLPAAPASADDDAASHQRGHTMQRSSLPVTLVGTVVRDDPKKSMAAVRVPGALLARNVHPGQAIVDGATLLDVERNRIILRHNGTTEFVPLSVASEPSTPTPARTLARFARTPDAVVALRRTDLDRALRDTTSLERNLTLSAPELDGHRLLVLQTVDGGGLFDLLQLQERDVLMQVNGEWVDDRRNPLWEALRADGPVTLLVMRAGQPQAFAYEIN